MTRFIVIRHGETEWNVQHRYQGQLDSPLTKKGVTQAEAIAERLADFSFDRLISSDLGRAVDTAAKIAAKHPNLPWEKDANLRERNFGVLAALTRSEAAEKLPREEDGYLNGGADFRIPDGESLRDVYLRSRQAFDYWAEVCEGQTVCVVTHGGLLGMFLRNVLGIPVESDRAYKFVNAAYNEFTYEDGAWILHVWGDITHLATIGAIDDL
ncbi:MAG: histidine phosphatase family protein [Verrucomicrobiota bacterium]